MRKITHMAAHALARGETKSFGNTETIGSYEGRFTQLVLHESAIVWMDRRDPDVDRVTITLAGWPTPTTRERINGALQVLAIPARLFQHTHRQRVSFGVCSYPVGDHEVITFERARTSAFWGIV
jgi:hypothetical protein